MDRGVEVEICCNSFFSALQAKLGGAKRVELCQSLSEGGTTPSAMAVKMCVEELGLHTRVLVRPRAGSYLYSSEDTLLIMREIELAHKLGAHGVVIGFLDSHGMVDVAKTKEAVKAAEGMSVTFHRAFDECSDWRDSLQRVIEAGCDKLLTSGCAITAEAGINVLKQIVEISTGYLDVIAASGVLPCNVGRIVKETGVREIHSSCKVMTDGFCHTDKMVVNQLIDVVNGI